MLKGIDVSNWQSSLSINAIAHDIDFCICKATESTYFVDSYCDGFIEDCKSNGLQWGFYHFAGHDKPESEAEFFYENCKNYFGHGVPVLDYETENNDNVEWCERFLTRLHELSGVCAMLYISAYRVPQYNDSWIPANCGLWIAGYPYDITSFEDAGEMTYNIGCWKFAAIWQFTSSLRLDGFNGRLDGDIAYMNKDAWFEYANAENSSYNDPAGLQPVQPVLNYYELAKQVVNGDWGNGRTRYESLTSAGYDYETVQELIDDYYELAQDIINGKWGNGWNRENALTGAGYNYELAQTIVNKILEN